MINTIIYHRLRNLKERVMIVLYTHTYTHTHIPPPPQRKLAANL